MEHGASKGVKEQSLVEVTIKVEVEVPVTPTTVHIGSKIGLNHLKHEPVLEESVKGELVFANDEILVESCQDRNAQHCVQVVLTPAVTSVVNEVCSASLNVKHEPVDIDIGPTMLQHMDVHYTLNKNMSAATEETTGSGVRKEGFEDKRRDNKTISRKHCVHMTRDEGHMNSILGQQMFLQKHLLSQHCVTSSNELKCDRAFQIPQLLSVPTKLCKQKSAKTSGTTAIAGPSNQSYVKKVGTKRDKGRSSKVNLNVNKSSHRSIRLSVCHICDAKFSAKCILLHHLQTHTGEKIYHCEKCDENFAQSQDLTEHMMVHIGDKPFQCDTCDARFTRISGLNQHMRVHSGDKPYQCSICITRFTQRSALTAHMRVHTGEKPYQCNMCNARFRRNSHLNMHMRVHTGRSPTGVSCVIQCLQETVT